MENIIGQRIKERRKELGITQTQIQHETSISSGNLSCIENGKYLPSAVALLELSRILKCSVDWLLTGQSSISDASIVLDNRETELLNGFREVSEDDKEELLCLLHLKRQKMKKIRDATAKLSPSTNTETSNIVS